MNKAELVDIVSEETGTTKKNAERVINSMLKAISDALVDGNKVQLVGFGVFEVKDRAARVGRNPHTKEAVSIPPSRVPQFKPGKALRDSIVK